MALIEWQEGLSVGVELIDDQHKTWIEHFNNLVKAVESTQGPAQISNTLGFLVDYTDTHFSTEETHMADRQYPDMAEHKAKHDALKVTLADLVQDFDEEGATTPLAAALDTFLGNWLVKHIQEVDMKLGAFLTS